MMIIEASRWSFAGLCALACSLIPHAMQAMSFSAWNGLGLALVIPCVQSLIADVYSASARGRAFGLLFLTSSLGEKPIGPVVTSV